MIRRNLLEMIGIVGIALTAGCAMEPKRGTLPQSYDCGGRAALGTGDSLTVANEKAMPAATDSDGRHFVLADEAGVVEYIVPDDTRLDIMTVTYDAPQPRDRGTWTRTARGTCVAQGGYTDALTRFMRGATTDEIAAELSLEPRDAGSLIHGAIIRLQRRLDY